MRFAFYSVVALSTFIAALYSCVLCLLAGLLACSTLASLSTYTHRAVLYLLSGLARPALPSSTNNANASASASSSIDALDSYLSTDLPPAALLPPAGAAASTTRDGDGSSSSSSTRRERGDPPSSVLLPPDEEALAQQQREAAAAEWRLLRDCLYAFQGIDGRHLTYDAGSGTHALDPEVG